MSHEEHPFRNGLVAGLAWPLLVILGVAAAVYRLTGMVPFPVRRSSQGELGIKLIDPNHIALYWRQWQAELDPLLERVRELIDQIRNVRGDRWLERE